MVKTTQLFAKPSCQVTTRVEMMTSSHLSSGNGHHVRMPIPAPSPHHPTGLFPIGGYQRKSSCQCQSELPELEGWIWSGPELGKAWPNEDQTVEDKSSAKRGRKHIYHISTVLHNSHIYSKLKTYLLYIVYMHACSCILANLCHIPIWSWPPKRGLNIGHINCFLWTWKGGIGVGPVLP